MTVIVCLAAFIIGIYFERWITKVEKTTVILEVDGQEIAKAVVPRMPTEVKHYGLQ